MHRVTTCVKNSNFTTQKKQTNDHALYPYEYTVNANATIPIYTVGRYYANTNLTTLVIRYCCYARIPYTTVGFFNKYIHGRVYIWWLLVRYTYIETNRISRLRTTRVREWHSNMLGGPLFRVCAFVFNRMRGWENTNSELYVYEHINIMINIMVYWLLYLISPKINENARSYL